MQKRVAKTLIKPCSNWLFSGHFRKRAPKSSKKHYLEKVFATLFRHVENPYKTCRIPRFRHANTRCEKPYKPLLKSSISESFTEKGLQNHQKSIRIFTINHMAFRNVGKPCKTCRKWRILRAHFRPSGRPERPGRPAKPMEPGTFSFCANLFFLDGQKEKVAQLIE